MRPFSSVPELFRWLRTEGWIVVLASSGKRDEVDHYKKLLQIEKLTDLDICSEDAEKSKPHADIFEVILKKLDNIALDRMLAIGDTPYDVEAAAKANIRTIALLGVASLKMNSPVLVPWRFSASNRNYYFVTQNGQVSYKSKPSLSQKVIETG